jgi:hypothetical protein
VAVIVTDEMAPISRMCIWPLIGFSTRYALKVWMDENRVSISGSSGRRTRRAAIPGDLRDEIFRSQIHIDGERLDRYQSLTGIAQLLGVEPGEEAIICVIEDLRESYSEQHIQALKSKDSLEAMKTRWEAAEGKVVEHRKNIRDMKVQLDAMSGAKCGIAKHKAVQEPRAMQKKLDAPYSAMVGQDRILLEIKTRKSELENQVRRQNTRIEECEREMGPLRPAKASSEGRIAKMEQRRRQMEC